ncbi:MAG: zinc ribbon domain-containing protein [Candidatus Helarchaeota archaeon]|nr:zinc ribbon domain-containing protein [Candidatus Helarchaeota archaeon]
MQSGRYLIVLIFFFTFLTALILLVSPIRMYNAKVTSFYTTFPGGTAHYTQLPNNTLTYAHIIIDNTGAGAYDLVNLYFEVRIRADVAVGGDITLVSRYWDKNLTVLTGNVTTIIISFNATYPHPQSRRLYIEILWGMDVHEERTERLAELTIGTDQEETFFNFQNNLMIIMAICTGLSLFIIITALKRDYKHYRSRRARRRPVPLPTIPPEPSPPPQPAPSPALVPPSIVAPPPTPPPSEPLPVDTMELIPCPQCGSKIDKTQIICSNCGYELPKCVVCNLVIDDDDEIETCTECGAVGHRTHFREWVHVKGSCPICKKNISFD